MSFERPPEPSVNDREAAERVLETRWTHQLYREYEQICFVHSLKLPRPLIRLAEVTSTWGSWDPQVRAITISKRLIREHAWDVVLEILKHEMAHQWVSVHYGDGAETPHGERFQAACRRLGVAEWAARAGGALPLELVPWQQRAVSKEEERILEKVEKLLALADSGNEHEALLAMQRVRELQERYSLECIGRSRGQDDMVSIYLTRKQKRFSTVESVIHAILVEHFRVRVVTCKLFDALALSEYVAAELLGARHDVLMAEYVHGFLWERVHAFWTTYRRDFAASGHAKNSYMMGLLAGFREKLAQGAPDARSLGLSLGIDPASTQALVQANQQRLEVFLERRHPRLGKRSFQTTVRDPSSYRAGQVEGRRLSLNKPVHEASGGRTRLLPGR